MAKKDDTNDGELKEMVETLLSIAENNSSEMGELRARLERLETKGPQGVTAPPADPWAGVTNPYLDVDWTNEEAVADVAASPITVFLRKGSILRRDGKIVTGPKPGVQMPDIESAFDQKQKFQEIEQIEWIAAKVRQARSEINRQAELKGMRLPYHWGPKGIAPERVYPKGVARV